MVAPLGIALAGPAYGEATVYAELEAWMTRRPRQIVDTMGHYGAAGRAAAAVRAPCVA